MSRMADASLESRRDGFLAAGATFVDVVARIRADQWTAPGLGVWKVRALVGHTNRSLVTLATYLQQPVEVVELATPAAYFVAVRGVAPADEVERRGVQAGEALGDDPATVVQASYDAASHALNDNGSADPAIHTAGGGMALSAYLSTRTFELVAHTLDIAAATGVGVLVPPAPMIEAMALAAELAATKTDAGAVLSALLGRRSLPQGYSVIDM